MKLFKSASKPPPSSERESENEKIINRSPKMLVKNHKLYWIF